MSLSEYTIAATVIAVLVLSILRLVNETLVQRKRADSDRYEIERQAQEIHEVRPRD